MLKDINIQYKKNSKIIVSDSQALKNAIINFINTSKQDIPFDLEIGCGILNYIYNPDLSTTEINTILRSAIAKQFSYLNNISVSVIQAPNSSSSISKTLEINISYTDPFTYEQQEINLVSIS